MERRQLVKRGGAVGVALLGGCLGSGEEDEFTLQVANTEIGQNSDGYLVVNVTVSNPGNEAQKGTLYVNSQLNDKDLVRVREIELDAHKTTEVTIEYDVKYVNVTSFTPKTDIQPSE